MFRSDEPDEIIARATETAGNLAKVIRRQKLSVSISGRDHVRVEGWTLLGTLLGVFPYTVWSRPIESGWEARCEARTLNGRVVGAAEAQCDRTERTWAGRDEYAIRSMAQTRATSKAMRQPLGFVMALAGFDATPAEEMDFAAGKAKPKTSAWQQLVDLAAQSDIPSDVLVATAKTMYAGRTSKSLTADECADLWAALEAEQVTA